MSLLWTQAMSWHNDDRSDEDEELKEFRDTRPYHERRPGLVDHISFVHDVPRHAADEALSQVEHGLSKRERTGRPSRLGHTTDYGFYQHFPLSDHKPDLHEHLRDARNWKHAEVDHIPTDEIRSTQSWVRHNGVAHNLFHPGLRTPYQEGIEGDPDYDPELDEDVWHEDDHNRDELNKENPESAHETNLPKFYRDEHGAHYTLDGHHRVAADLILGKSHIEGRVLSSDRDENGKVVHSWEQQHEDEHEEAR